MGIPRFVSRKRLSSGIDTSIAGARDGGARTKIEVVVFQGSGVWVVLLGRVGETPSPRSRGEWPRSIAGAAYSFQFGSPVRCRPSGRHLIPRRARIAVDRAAQHLALASTRAWPVDDASISDELEVGRRRGGELGTPMTHLCGGRSLTGRYRT